MYVSPVISQYLSSGSKCRIFIEFHSNKSIRLRYLLEGQQPPSLPCRLLSCCLHTHAYIMYYVIRRSCLLPGVYILGVDTNPLESVSAACVMRACARAPCVSEGARTYAHVCVQYTIYTCMPCMRIHECYRSMYDVHIYDVRRTVYTCTTYNVLRTHDLQVYGVTDAWVCAQLCVPTLSNIARPSMYIVRVKALTLMWSWDVFTHAHRAYVVHTMNTYVHVYMLSFTREIKYAFVYTNMHIHSCTCPCICVMACIRVISGMYVSA